GRERGGPPKERGVNVGSNAGQNRKGKEKETDVFELSDTELEEAYKIFRMDRNDDDSDEDGGGVGRKRKRKEKKTDDFELSDTELQEAYKRFSMDRNVDEDSDEDGGGAGQKRKGREKETDDFKLSDNDGDDWMRMKCGAGIGAQNLSNLVY
nr:hypothetical protein [Tanacetum cinerariifolium]